MKTGIVTFYDHANYGAVLQAYALQEALKSCGHEAFHVNFRSTDTSETDEGNNVPSFLKQIREHGDKRNELFADFRRQYLSEAVFSDELVCDTDFFVVGSDQVWNPVITRGDKRYFLDFADKSKRISYAASFGQELPSKAEEYYASQLKDFTAISVREQFGADTIFRLTGCRAEVNCDPVFLLETAQWEKLIPRSNESEGKYHLLIMVQNDMTLYRKCKEEAERENAELKVITASFCPPIGFDAWSGISVTQWLTLIRNAEKVVTSSFHGLAFSLIFQKHFRIIDNCGKLSTRNARLTELLNRIGYFGDGAPDYARIASALKQDRAKGYEYLRRVIKNV